MSRIKNRSEVYAEMRTLGTYMNESFMRAKFNSKTASYNNKSICTRRWSKRRKLSILRGITK
jgi:hypothetical protein